ncbi:MAG: hypothetical protein GW789_00780 [Ignavibacteria bacterium]|nr:hypothetical protein [Ignavibacteria bacterium]
MNIYCAGAIKGDISYQQYYKIIIEEVAKRNINALSELNIKLQLKTKLNDKEIYERDIQWLNNSKAMIAEVSGASLGVGFEIGYALFHLNIPVLALYHKNVDKVSAMITGCSSTLLDIFQYAETDELKEYINNFILKIKSL